jgi:hypothetical protein
VLVGAEGHLMVTTVVEVARRRDQLFHWLWYLSFLHFASRLDLSWRWALPKHSHGVGHGKHLVLAAVGHRLDR